jgi:hypothetical protein
MGAFKREDLREPAFELFDFYPTSPDWATVPQSTPEELRWELREAGRAAGAGAYRAGSTTLRSVLEKTLKANGYTKGDLKQKIDAAADDGTITKARQSKAHSDVRVFGNDIVHDEWRPVSAEEFELARRYVVWILEDFYDDRPTVQEQLRLAGRLSSTD